MTPEAATAYCQSRATNRKRSLRQRRLAVPVKPKTTNQEVGRMIRHQQSAWIMLNGVTTTECLIMDISKRGANIVPKESYEVPRFRSQKRQSSDLIWCRGRMLGIKFVA
jgi:hypothetical protein